MLRTTNRTNHTLNLQFDQPMVFFAKNRDKESLCNSDMNNKRKIGWVPICSRSILILLLFMSFSTHSILYGQEKISYINSANALSQGSELYAELRYEEALAELAPRIKYALILPNCISP